MKRTLIKPDARLKRAIAAAALMAMAVVILLLVIGNRYPPVESFEVPEQVTKNLARNLHLLSNAEHEPTLTSDSRRFPVSAVRVYSPPLSDTDADEIPIHDRTNQPTTER